MFSLLLKAEGEDCYTFVWPSGQELRLRKSGTRRLKVGQSYKLLLRPENIEFEKREGRGHIRLFSAKSISNRFAGAWSESEVEGEGIRLLVIHPIKPSNAEPPVGRLIDLWVRPEDLQVLEA
jgi:ABC-type Fe3+/spermidine/putrescine transport system ATPase subunit